MKDAVLESEVAQATQARKKPQSVPGDPGSLEQRLTARLDASLEGIKRSVAEGLCKLQERIDPLIDDRVKKALNGDIASLANTTKEALATVVQAVLFDSGILERLVRRIVDEKIAEKRGPAGGAPAGDLSEGARKELAALVGREVSAALAGEQLKMIVDDKFRAITHYMKSEVIPKAVQEVLRSKAGASPAGMDSLPGKSGQPGH